MRVPLLSLKRWMLPAADSAGIPFEGRSFHDHPFAGDDGSVPSALQGPLERWASLRSVADALELADLARDLVDGLRGARVLIPLLAEAGSFGHTPEGRVVEKTQELSVVSVAAPDGYPMGLMFSDVASMATWNQTARPVPVEAERVAAWALTEGVSRVVLNPTADSECVFRSGPLAALVTGQPWVAPWADPEVMADVLSPWRGDEDSNVRDVQVSPGWDLHSGTGPDLVVRLVLRDGLNQHDLEQLSARWNAAWASSEAIRQKVSGILLRFVAEAGSDRVEGPSSPAR